MSYRGLNVELVVAMTQSRIMGANNQLPWKLKEDLKHFKNLTKHHPIIMGRKTFDSIGRTLPERLNIIVSRNSELKIPNTLVAGDLKSAMNLCLENRYMPPDRKIFIIGGGQIFQEAMPYADRLHITWVNQAFEGDIYFPEFDLKSWRAITSRSLIDENIPIEICEYVQT